MLLDVDGSELVILRQTPAEDDGVLEVVAFPTHERHEDVLPQREVSLPCGRAVGDDVPHLHPVAHFHDGAVVEACPLIGADEFQQVELAPLARFGEYDDAVGVSAAPGVYRRDHAIDVGYDDLPAVFRHAVFHAGAHYGRLRAQKGDGLPLHVRPHQRAVGVVVFQEGD